MSCFTINYTLSNEYVVNEKGLSTPKSEKSSTVAECDEISNYVLIKDLILVVEYLDYLEENPI